MPRPGQQLVAALVVLIFTMLVLCAIQFEWYKAIGSAEYQQLRRSLGHRTGFIPLWGHVLLCTLAATLIVAVINRRK